MFYEEKVINGLLHCRNTPNGEWRPVKSPKADAVNALLALSDEDRTEVFAHFCVFCGDHEASPCHCMRDE